MPEYKPAWYYWRSKIAALSFSTICSLQIPSFRLFTIESIIVPTFQSEFVGMWHIQCVSADTQSCSSESCFLCGLTTMCWMKNRCRKWFSSTGLSADTLYSAVVFSFCIKLFDLQCTVLGRSCLAPFDAGFLEPLKVSNFSDGALWCSVASHSSRKNLPFIKHHLTASAWTRMLNLYKGLLYKVAPKRCSLF